MLKIDVLKFNGAELIKRGCQVNVKTFCFYNELGSNNAFAMTVSETAAYEIEVIDKNGKRFKTNVQPHTPKSTRGVRVRQCSVYGEVVTNDGGAITINNVNLNF